MEISMESYSPLHGKSKLNIEPWLKDVAELIDGLVTSIVVLEESNLRNLLFRIKKVLGKIRKELYNNDYSVAGDAGVIIGCLEDVASYVKSGKGEFGINETQVVEKCLGVASVGRSIIESLEGVVFESSPLSSLEKKLRFLEKKIEEAVVATRINEKESKLLLEGFHKINNQQGKLRQSLAGIEKDVADAIGNKINEAEKILQNLKEKEAEINDLVGVVSGTSIAGSYGESAKSELKWANYTRAGSVFLMLAIAVLVGYSLLETTTPNFDWKVSVFRLIFSAALSVPAAYLSRESSKHRAKQYQFLQVSLDLKSITPYLASLPDSEQHKLKSELAGRLFGSSTQACSSDSYPIDIHALLMKIIDKVPGGGAEKASIPQEGSPK